MSAAMLVEPPLLQLHDDDDDEQRQQSFLATLYTRIINDPLVDNNIFPSIIILVISFLIILPIKLYILVSFLSFVVGYSYLAITLKKPSPPSFSSKHFAFSDISNSATFDQNTNNTYNNNKPENILIISRRVDRQIRLLIKDLLDSVINSWYRRLCFGGGTQYQDYIHHLLMTTISKAIYQVQISNSLKTTSLLFSNLGDVFKLHLQFLKTKEAANADGAMLDGSSNHSTKPKPLTFTPIMQSLKYFSYHIVRLSLPEKEFESKLLRDLLIELISGSVLLPLLDRLSEPDFINEAIISTFSKKDPSTDVEFSLSERIAAYTASLILPLDLKKNHGSASGGGGGVKHVNGKSSNSKKNNSNNDKENKNNNNDNDNDKENIQKNINELTLENILENNDFFIEFMDYLRDVAAPPYLHFLINLDALEQYTRMAFDDLPPSSAIKDYIRSFPSSIKKDQLRMIRQEATDLFLGHFDIATTMTTTTITNTTTNPIPIPPSIREEMVEQLERSDDPERMDLVGHEIYSSVNAWIKDHLRRSYFGDFVKSDRLKCLLTTNTTESLFVSDEAGSGACDDSINNVYDDNSSNDSICSSNSSDSSNSNNSSSSSKDSIQPPPLDTQEILDQLQNMTTGTGTKRRGELESILRERGVDELLFVDLQSLVISVKPVITPSIKVEQADKGWIGNLISASGTTATGRSGVSGGGGNALFAKKIEITLQTSADMRTVAQIIKNYSDILSLHKELASQIPKVSRIPFPSKEDPSLFANLLQYLRLLMSDELIVGSGIVRKFLLNTKRDRNYTFDSSITSPSVAASIAAMDSSSLSSSSSSSFLHSSSFGARERSHSEPGHDIIGGATDFKAFKGRRVFWVEEGPAFVDKIETLRQLSEDLLEKTATSSNASQSLNVRGVGDDDIEVLVESIFSIAIEAFDIGHPSQWLRLNLFSIFKQIIKQAYGDSLSKMLTKLTRDLLSEGSILRAIARIRLLLFTGPGGEFDGNGSNNGAVDGDGLGQQEQHPHPPPQAKKSKHRLLSTVVKAKHLWLSSIPESIYGVAGRYNTVVGMGRIFQGFQDKMGNQRLLLEMARVAMGMFVEGGGGGQDVNVNKQQYQQQQKQESI